MAESNDPSMTSRLTNSYFFYGTHPLKVPHSKSSFPLTQQHTNHHGLSATRSLQSISQSPQDDVDQTSEIFEDALESFDDDDNSTHPNRKQQNESTIDLPQAFLECQQITQLFFENHLNEALQRTKEQEDRSLYHSLCHSVISFTQATMTFNADDIEATIQALRHTSTMAKKYEPYRTWIPFGLSAKPQMTEFELHAKLIYAEVLLKRAMLSFVQDQSLLSFISGALKIKECNDIFVKLAKQNDPSRFSTSQSYEHFDSGVRMGNGAFNLMISNLPQRVIRYLEFAGFSGNRDYGLSELEKSAFSNGLRAPFSTQFLLIYHTFILPLFGNNDGNLELCQTLVEHYLQRFPDSYLFLFFQARLQTLHCQLDQAIRTHEYAIHCQSDWKDLHHLAHWEILWCHALQAEWKKASAMAKTLLEENNWSKATYCYLLATFLFEENHATSTDELVELYQRVPGLKIRLAGKSNPLEKYAIKQCEHYLVQRWLFLPALELIYLLNGFYILSYDQQRLSNTLEIVNNALTNLEGHHRNDRFYSDSYGSGLLLRGVLLHFLGRYDEAHRALNEIIMMVKRFACKSFLVPNALLEKAMIHIDLKEKQKAIECLQKSLNDYKDYLLESRLQFRINAAMQTVKRMDN